MGVARQGTRWAGQGPAVLGAGPRWGPGSPACVSAADGARAGLPGLGGLRAESRIQKGDEVEGVA